MKVHIHEYSKVKFSGQRNYQKLNVKDWTKRIVTLSFSRLGRYGTASCEYHALIPTVEIEIKH